MTKKLRRMKKRKREEGRGKAYSVMRVPPEQRMNSGIYYGCPKNTPLCIIVYDVYIQMKSQFWTFL